MRNIIVSSAGSDTLACSSLLCTGRAAPAGVTSVGRGPVRIASGPMSVTVAVP
ncbi:hypothetical protein SALBM135S_09503 [Streptomyces alboniger]